MGGGPIWPETVLYAQDLFPEQFRSLFDQKISAEEEHHPPSSLGATVNRLTRMRISCVFQVLYKKCWRMRDNSLEITCGRARCQDRNSHASPPGSWCSREQTNKPMSRLPFSHLHISIEYQWLICPRSNIVPWLISWNNQHGVAEDENAILLLVWTCGWYALRSLFRRRLLTSQLRRLFRRTVLRPSFNKLLVCIAAKLSVCLKSLQKKLEENESFVIVHLRAWPRRGWLRE